MDIKKETREKLADLCHKQWSGWMKYLFSKCEILPNTNKPDYYIIPTWAVRRWKHQIKTPYSKLSFDEKESDRKEADRFIKLLNLYGKN